MRCNGWFNFKENLNHFQIWFIKLNITTECFWNYITKKIYLILHLASLNIKITQLQLWENLTFSKRQINQDQTKESAGHFLSFSFIESCSKLHIIRAKTNPSVEFGTHRLINVINMPLNCIEEKNYNNFFSDSRRLEVCRHGCWSSSIMDIFPRHHNRNNWHSDGCSSYFWIRRSGQNYRHLPW